MNRFFLTANGHAWYNAKSFDGLRLIHSPSATHAFMDERLSYLAHEPFWLRHIITFYPCILFFANRFHGPISNRMAWNPTLIVHQKDRIVMARTSWTQGFKNLKLGYKLAGGFGLILMLFLFVLLFSSLSTRKSIRSFKGLIRTDLAMADHAEQADRAHSQIIGSHKFYTSCWKR